MSILLVNADSLHIPLADNSVQCCVCSPPYWGLRSYGIGTENGELGLEPTPEAYVAHMVAVFREVRRVLREDGTAWVNLGDSYSSGMRSAYDDDRHKYRTARAHDKRPPTPNNLKEKDLVGIPWRVAFALQADGWYLRSDIIWHKPNPMPESVTDRPTKAHEYVFLLTKQARYYFDQDAVKEQAVNGDPRQPLGSVGVIGHPNERRRLGGNFSRKYAEEQLNHGSMRLDRPEDKGTRNIRTVWTIPTQPTPFAHFATYPEKLVEPCIKAGTSERGRCPKCGKAWERVTKTEYIAGGDGGGMGTFRDSERAYRGSKERKRRVDTTLNWQPSCQCNAEPVPCIVLDPFAGSGTTGIVARRLGRHFVGLDLSRAYLHDIARRRLELDRLQAWTDGAEASDDGWHDLPIFRSEE